MKILESFLLDNNKIFFGFAYSLLSDDLQAQQVVIDAIYVFTLKRQDLIDQLHDDKSSLKQVDVLAQINKFILTQIFSIGQKRIIHLKNAIDSDGSFLAFYEMNMVKRAVIYLKYKTQTAFSEIAEIIDVNEFELMGILSSAQKNLIENLGYDTKHLFV
ncbi:MAG: hypothetical protein A2381_18865 [Bdellovibrionales bacterium RIFOXYB1_FULL_37_110]|nr:MAG: hypothetical protein A2181_05175 [Bdellovibrionales bacterium RIFOXYA1_FULL_38_20]OFZ46567.1 MAG: hypothetical protein A2417_13870 [Bdellovibrionales bacterium RIFOXYC1_FULL_37_79]OFZ55929.1 MAG: hypothetical protein A2328_10080 [Bdellovibrionales bacterium RIFOXYB2_FULL_36_6]OFZ57689.1 MAG: hypothetical protein A2381_18865 [Bdellovibrionales bacterium RIFOXYB1_FULL_37_110]OFZ62945.1 MAG: hypothetical protein A2577_11520 [Bdellovibrionales bacterium RIFOXYD1_FULL_36_51]